MQAKNTKQKKKPAAGLNDTIIEQLDESSEKIAYTARVVETTL